MDKARTGEIAKDIKPGFMSFAFPFLLRVVY